LMATLKTSFLIDLLLRLGFDDAETYPPELLADIKSKLSAKYQREIEQGELEDAVSYISDVNTIHVDDTTSIITDLSISSTESTDSLLHFTTSAIHKREISKREERSGENSNENSMHDLASSGLPNDSTNDLVSRIQHLDLTKLEETIHLQKSRVEEEENVEDEENEKDTWTTSNLYDEGLYDPVQQDRFPEEDRIRRVEPSSRGCKPPLLTLQISTNRDQSSQENTTPSLHSTNIIPDGNKMPSYSVSIGLGLFRPDMGLSLVGGVVLGVGIGLLR
jgi:hypothetical protein